MSNVALSEPPEDAAEILAESKAREVIGRLTLEFVDSSRDTLSALEILLGNIAVGAVSKQSAFDEIFRAAHNIKGNAATFGYPLIGVIAHRLEDYIAGRGEIGGDQVGDIQIFLDRMLDVLRHEPGGKAADAGEIVRGLPVKPSFDPRDVVRTNVEILLVMPKGAAARFVERELRACGYRVTNLPAPFMAIEMAVLTQPNLVIAAALLLDLDGIDLACAFKAMPTTRHIPFSLITSLDFGDGRLKVLPEDVPLIRKGAEFSEDLAQALNVLGIT
jgi:HPt (histidine-containing phosphotransfer) domain-containing protein/CheY-like chemotaxis protein